MSIVAIHRTTGVDDDRNDEDRNDDDNDDNDDNDRLDISGSIDIVKLLLLVNSVSDAM